MNGMLGKINGYGAMLLRGAIVVLIPVAIFFGNQLSQDIRTKFTELTLDMRIVRNDIQELRGEIVGKAIYYKDQAEIRAWLLRLEDRSARRQVVRNG